MTKQATFNGFTGKQETVDMSTPKTTKKSVSNKAVKADVKAAAQSNYEIEKAKPPVSTVPALMMTTEATRYSEAKAASDIVKSNKLGWIFDSVYKQVDEGVQWRRIIMYRETTDSDGKKVKVYFVLSRNENGYFEQWRHDNPTTKANCIKFLVNLGLNMADFPTAMDNKELVRKVTGKAAPEPKTHAIRRDTTPANKTTTWETWDYYTVKGTWHSNFEFAQVYTHKQAYFKSCDVGGEPVSVK